MPRKSRIDRLDPELRKLLDKLLQDPAVSQLEATREVNVYLKAEGEDPLSKSSVNRYSQRVEKVGQKMKESREMAGVLINSLGAAPQGETGKLLNEMLRGLVFDVLLVQQSGDKDVSPKALSALARTLQRLEAAATVNVKRDAEISRQAREAAAKDAGDEARKQGLSSEKAQQIIDRVLAGNV